MATAADSLGMSPYQYPSPTDRSRPAEPWSLVRAVCHLLWPAGDPLYIDRNTRRLLSNPEALAALPRGRRLDLLTMAMVCRYSEPWRWATRALDQEDAALALACRFLLDDLPATRPVIHPSRAPQIREWLGIIDHHGQPAHRLALLSRWCGADWLVSLEVAATTLAAVADLVAGPALAAEFGEHYLARVQTDLNHHRAVTDPANGQRIAQATMDEIVTAVRALLDRHRGSARPAAQ